MRKYKGNYYTEEEIKDDQIKTLKKRMALLGLLFLFLVLGFLVYEYKFAEKSIFNKGDKFEEYDPNYSIEDNSNVTQSSGSNTEPSNTVSNETKPSNEVKPSNQTSATVKSNTTKSNTTKSNTTSSNTTKSNTTTQSNTVSNTPTSNTQPKSNTVVVNTKSFAEDSWDTIAEAAKYNQTSAYKVGDTKTVTVDGKNYTVRVANNSKPSECSSGSFSQTSCGLVIEFAVVTEYQQLDNSCVWGNCTINTYLNGTFLSKLPSDLSKNIVSTKVVTGHGTESESNYTTNDKIFLLSVKEVLGNAPLYDTANNQTRQLDYYKNHGVTSTNYSAAYKNYKSTSTVKPWWLRTPAPNANNATAIINSSSDDLFGQRQSTGIGISPAFKVG